MQYFGRLRSWRKKFFLCLMSFTKQILAIVMNHLVSWWKLEKGGLIQIEEATTADTSVNRFLVLSCKSFRSRT